MLKAVLFDLDGTLHDRNATIFQWLKGHTRRFDLPAAYAARFLKLDDFGYRPKSEVMPLLVREFGLAHPAQALLDDFSDHAFGQPVPVPHTHAVLAELRQRGVLLGIVTNGWELKQRQTLHGLDLTRRVDDVVISKAVGLSKPDPAIYRLALERLGVDAADAWFVGDSPRNDITGPQAVGLRAAFLCTGHALAGERPDAVLGDLRDVLALA
ncbi:HAD family hydrolase [Deinococcus marmoris]|uniref:FMN hydrolase/5-Amino-6-(5'-phosphoribitylamino)uracil phosphatase n=1 Tax=Deinococcus marmoris TaxID=249408 RepID=A0A1U7P450_9DEIO|nr:HAD family hydrolase [Deinococcus marmoris]OLV19942.1 FMN hydrolase/5-Amino-6-(5'-phosphoribitylamino)uracil phosphatase [Deinococcus marmoris]